MRTQDGCNTTMYDIGDHSLTVAHLTFVCGRYIVLYKYFIIVTKTLCEVNR